MRVTVNRVDFRNIQDGPPVSLFHCLLDQLNIPTNKWDDIEEVELEVEGFTATDIDGEELNA